jgi:hypothetical protein
MEEQIVVDANSAATPFPHNWEHMLIPATLQQPSVKIGAMYTDKLASRELQRTQEGEFG